MSMPETVQSVVQAQRNGPLIAAAAQLWINDDDRVLDMTYGRGNFWTVYRPTDLITNDLNPETDAEHHEDFHSTSWPDGSFDVVVYDPPYIAQGGRDTSTVQEMLDAYGLRGVPGYGNIEAYIRGGLRESVRVLAPSGRLFVKCMDYINGGKYRQGRHQVVAAAMELGLEQVDEFVHYSGVGPQPHRERQLHSRRAHSFLCVFQK